jgi:2-dehydro-3-deoxyphosphogluconate aldolase/(4S)-4-hydroxy-2-oxoglutarate aldolase
MNPSQSGKQITNDELLKRIEETRIIAILRGEYSQLAEKIAETLLRAGVAALEITMNSPSALEMIERLSSEFGNRLLVGAGTVLRVSEVEATAAAGARFILSPNRNAAVIRRAKELGMLAFPGCLTCSEIIDGLEAGADAVKLFPAQMIGPEALKALCAPLGNIRTIPTGGICDAQIPAYLAAGAWAFGVGSELISPQVKTPEGLDDLFERARRFVNATRTSSRP